MTSEEIDIKFNISVEAINAHTDPFPADTLLKLYAYYKRATASSDMSSGGKPLIDAFKTNALFQTRHLTQDEAKELYIETANHYFLYRK
jgi:acyl-CoA-binding protein